MQYVDVSKENAGFGKGWVQNIPRIFSMFSPKHLNHLITTVESITACDVFPMCCYGNDVVYCRDGTIKRITFSWSSATDVVLIVYTWWSDWWHKHCLTVEDGFYELGFQSALSPRHSIEALILPHAAISVWLYPRIIYYYRCRLQISVWCPLL